jgi:hypothetical protein
MTETRSPVLLLVGAPLLMAVGRLLLEPVDDQDFAGTLRDAAAHPSRSGAGWFITVVANGLLAVAAVAMTRPLRDAGRRGPVIVGSIPMSLSWAGCAGIGVWGMSLGYQGQATDQDAQVKILKAFNDGQSGLFTLLLVVGIVGHVVLAVTLAPGKAHPRGHRSGPHPRRRRRARDDPGPMEVAPHRVRCCARDGTGAGRAQDVSTRHSAALAGRPATSPADRSLSAADERHSRGHEHAAHPQLEPGKRTAPEHPDRPPSARDSRYVRLHGD